MLKKLLILSLILNLLFIVSLLIIIVKVGGFSYFIQKVGNIGKNKVYNNRQMVFSQLPSLRNKIVFVGNSLTSAGEWAELLSRSDVANRGIDGDIVLGVETRIVPILEDKPKKVFLMIGINNLLRGASVDQVKADYKILLQTCSKYPSTRFYIQSILPVNNEVLYDKKLDNRKISEVNDYIKNLCLKYKFDYIPLYSLFLDSSGKQLREEFTVDGLHLSGKGYQVWVEVLKEKL